MTETEARHRLRTYQANRALLHAIQEKLKNDNFIFISAIDYSKAPVRSSGSGITTAERYCQHMQNSRKWNDALLKQAREIQAEIQKTERWLYKALKFLSQLQSTIILMHYANGESYVNIAQKLNYSECHIKRESGKAIRLMII